jgi:membrane protease YdiL (CAAX protease family)
MGEMTPLAPTALIIRLGVYIFFYIVIGQIAGLALGFVFGLERAYLFVLTVAGLLASIGCNLLSLRIFESRPFADAGLWWNHAGARNLLLGLAGGIGSAVLVLFPPVAVGAAHFVHIENPEANIGTLAFTFVVLFCGASGEELVFRGYGFQILLRSLGPYATILPVGVLFAALHSFNPHASYIGIANTAGFGILFGYAFLRSRDLWLPIGLHFGWNVTLPLFGASVSGLRIGVTGYRLEWTSGALWSGGEYGPEGSILTSAVILILFAYVWKAPVRAQTSPLAGPPAGEAPCVAEPQP